MWYKKGFTSLESNMNLAETLRNDCNHYLFRVKLETRVLLDLLDLLDKGWAPVRTFHVQFKNRCNMFLAECLWCLTSRVSPPSVYVGTTWTRWPCWKGWKQRSARTHWTPRTSWSQWRDRSLCEYTWELLLPVTLIATSWKKNILANKSDCYMHVINYAIQNAYRIEIASAWS